MENTLKADVGSELIIYIMSTNAHHNNLFGHLTVKGYTGEATLPFQFYPAFSVNGVNS